MVTLLDAATFRIDAVYESRDAASDLIAGTAITGDCSLKEQ
jgi:hypothetical protein